MFRNTRHFRQAVYHSNKIQLFALIVCIHCLSFLYCQRKKRREKTQKILEKRKNHKQLAMTHYETFAFRIRVQKMSSICEIQRRDV